MRRARRPRISHRKGHHHSAELQQARRLLAVQLGLCLHIDTAGPLGYGKERGVVRPSSSE